MDNFVDARDVIWVASGLFRGGVFCDNERGCINEIFHLIIYMNRDDLAWSYHKLAGTKGNDRKI